MIQFQGLSGNYTNPTTCRLLKVTQFFRKGQFIIYARGWAGKNEGWVTSNSRQSEGGGGGGIRKSAHNEEGLPDILFCFIFNQMLSEGSRN